MARERDTGARGLRSIVEEVMTDLMFELPEMEAKGKFTVTEGVIRGERIDVRVQADAGQEERVADYSPDS